MIWPSANESEASPIASQPSRREELLFPDQRAGRVEHRRVVRHHPVRVEDLSLVALAEALADGLELLHAVADGVVQALELVRNVVGGDVVSRHARAPAVDRMHLSDGDAGRCSDADELGQAPEAYQLPALARRGNAFATRRGILVQR